MSCRVYQLIGSAKRDGVVSGWIQLSTIPVQGVETVSGGPIYFAACMYFSLRS